MEQAVHLNINKDKNKDHRDQEGRFKKRHFHWKLFKNACNQQTRLIATICTKSLCNM